MLEKPEVQDKKHKEWADATAEFIQRHLVYVYRTETKHAEVLILTTFFGLRLWLYTSLYIF